MVARTLVPLGLSLSLLALSCATEEPQAPYVYPDGGAADDGSDGDAPGDDGADELEDEDDGTIEEEDTDAPLEFDAVKALSRASLDLRGIRPSLEELDQVRADPDAYDDLVEGYLYG